MKSQLASAFLHHAHVSRAVEQFEVLLQQEIRSYLQYHMLQKRFCQCLHLCWFRVPSNDIIGPSSSLAVQIRVSTSDQLRNSIASAVKLQKTKVRAPRCRIGDDWYCQLGLIDHDRS